MVSNKIIHSKDLSSLNAEIYKHNKCGWVVKQIFVCGDLLKSSGGIYVLLEDNGKIK